MGCSRCGKNKPGSHAARAGASTDGEYVVAVDGEQVDGPYLTAYAAAVAARAHTGATIVHRARSET